MLAVCLVTALVHSSFRALRCTQCISCGVHIRDGEQCMRWMSRSTVVSGDEESEGRSKAGGIST